MSLIRVCFRCLCCPLLHSSFFFSSPFFLSLSPFPLCRFDGKGSRVEIPFQQVLNLGSSWTAELWAYVEEGDGAEFQPMVALCSYSFSSEQVKGFRKHIHAHIYISGRRGGWWQWRLRFWRMHAIAPTHREISESYHGSETRLHPA